MSIPTIPGSARVPDVQIGAQRNVQPRLQALGALRQASGAAAGSVQDALGLVADYEEHKQKAEENYAFNMVLLSGQKLHADFLSKVKAMPDQEIVNNWHTATGEWRSNQMEQWPKDMSPEAKQLLNIKMDQFVGTSAAGFQGMADLLAQKRRVGAADALGDEFLKTGDPDNMARAIAAQQNLVRQGDQTQDEMNAKVQTYPQVLDIHQAQNLASQAPNLAFHKMEEGGFKNIKDENVRLSLQGKFYAAWRRDMTIRYQDIRKQQEGGKIYTKKEFTDMADREEIEGSSIKASLDAQGGEVNDEDIKANVSRVHDMILGLPKDGSEEERQIAVAEIFASEAYQALPNRAKKEFDGDLKQGESSLPPLHRTQAAEMKRTFEEVTGLVPTLNTNQRMAPFIEGGIKKIETMPEADLRQAFGRHGTRQQILQREARRETAARAWYGDAQQQYMSWAKTKKGQEATPQEADAERVRLGFGTYGTVLDVVRDFQAGKIDAATCKKIAFVRFGME